MRPTFSRLAGLMAAVAALAAGPRALAAQKALVYCPAADTRGCDAIVAALTPGFPDGVDRASDAGLGVDLRTADLFAYAAFVVPSLADNATSQPYAFLRDATVAHKLRDALMGRRVFWSGTPDQGSTNRTLKDALLANLARFAASNSAAARGPGLVVLQDVSDDAAARYGWLRGILGANLTADVALASYGSVRGMTATATEILTSGGTLIAYSNMAMQGFQLPTGAAGVTLDAVGQTGTSTGGQVVLATMAGVSATSAVVATDKDDYAPGTTVVMTGAGFQAGETVSLVLHEDPEVHTVRSFTATANAQGGFTFTGFAPEAHDIGVRFILTATGQASGYKAQTTFTDGNAIKVPLVGAQSPTSVNNNGSSATFAVTVEGTGNTPSNSSIAMSATGLPAGASSSFNPVSFTIGKNGLQAVTLTVTVSSSVAPGSYPFTITATGAAEVNSAPATLVVGSACTAPAMTTQPTAQSIGYGANATFTAAASGTALMGVQWQSSTNGTDWSNIQGATSATLTITKPAVAQSGTQYHAVFTNGCGTVTSNAATLAVAAKALTVTGVTATGHEYDGTTSATLNTGSAALVGVINPDAVTLSASGASASFANANVGTAKAVTVSGLALAGTEAGNYSLTQPTGLTADITPATATVAFGAASYACVYGASCTAPTATATGLASPATGPAGTVGISYSGTANDGSTVSGTTLPTKAGTYTATATYTPGASDNYKAPATAPTATLTIGRGIVSLSATGTTFTYTGNPTGPAFAGDVAQVDIMYSGVSPTSYGPGATQPKDVGGYAFAATLRDANNYAFAAGATTAGNFAITKAVVTVAFSGAPYSCTYDPAGACAAVASPTGLASPASSPTGTVAVTYSGTANDGTTLTNATAAPVKAGTYTATATYLPGTNDNYDAPATAPTAAVTINRASVTVAFPATTTVDYNGTPRSVSASTVSPSGFSGFTVKYDAALQAPSNVGTYAVTAALTDAHNYALSAASTPGQLVIAPVAATVAFTQQSYTCTFGAACTAPSAAATGLGSPASSPSGSVAITYSGTANDGSPVSSSAVPTKAGTYTATAIYTPGSGDNYKAPTAAPTASLTIGRATPVVSVTQPAAIVYGTANATISGTAKTAGGLAASGSIAVAVNGGTAVTATIDQTTGAFSATVPTGTLNANLTGYDVSASYAQSANFEAAGDASKKLVVNKAPATGTFSLATLPTKTYGDDGFSVASYAQAGASGVAPSFAVANNSVGCTVTPTGTVTIGSATGAGQCVIEAIQAEAPNYQAGTSSSGFAIGKATLTVTPNDASKTYGEAAVLGGVISGQKYTDTFTATYASAGAAVLAPVGTGSYPITVGEVSGTKIDNYTVQKQTGTLTVSRRAVTVKATDVTRVYGESTPAFGIELAGGTTLAPGETLAVLGTPTFSPAGTTVTGSPHAIGVSALTNPNYNIGYATAAAMGKLTVTPRAITVTADPQTKVYGTADPAPLTYQVTSGSLVNGDVFTGTLARVAGDNVVAGGYAIEQGTLALNANYALTYVGAKLTITPRPVTITPTTGLSKVYGTADPTFTYTASETLISGNTFTGALSRVPGENVVTSPYAITMGTLTAGANYSLSLPATPVTFAITPASATVTLGNLVQPANNIQGPTATTTPASQLANVVFTYTVGGVQTTTRPAAVGVYPVTATINNANYTAAPDNGYFVIYDPNGGFVTGGGWITSPTGACRLTESCAGISGKANFGFVSKYQNGARTPTGNTEFQFQAANLNFKSTVYEWLTVSGPRAQFKGDGTINGAAGFKFILTAVDGSVSGGGGTDQFRIKIMRVADGVIVYDNMMGDLTTLDGDVNATLTGNGTLLGGGSISIKK